ncbi:MAG: HAMP domain-containing sensor histidine kinase [Vicingaceae bacterium]|nr:HAMP domain-containing sensor histidine kinase [Vicingaceae bacterium]
MDSTIKLTDKELINELLIRFDQNNKMVEELTLLNEKLLESEKMKSNFLSNIKNEINNPLSVILGSVLNLMDNDVNNDSLSHNLRIIYNEAFDLNFQLKNIFYAAEIESGQFLPQISNVDVAQLVKKVVDNFTFLAVKNNIEFKLECPSSLMFKTDAQKFSLIVANLLSNAIKFNNNSGIVKVDLSIKDDRELNLTIKDDGVGISEEKKKYIFDRFKQAEHGMSKQFSGHGLGLSVVSSILEVIKGKIILESQENTGTKVCIQISEGDLNTDEYSDSENSFMFFEEDSNEIKF